MERLEGGSGKASRLVACRWPPAIRSRKVVTVQEFAAEENRALDTQLRLRHEGAATPGMGGKSGGLAPTPLPSNIGLLIRSLKLVF